MKNKNSLRKYPIKDLLIQKEEEKKKKYKDLESAFFFSSHPTMNQLEGTAHKLFMQEQPVVQIVPKQQQGTERKRVKRILAKADKLRQILPLGLPEPDGWTGIEMYCPNPLCRRMQYFWEKGNVVTTTFGKKHLAPHQCQYCWGKQAFAENTFMANDWHDVENKEVMTTRKNFELEMFPKDGFSRVKPNGKPDTTQYFEEGKQVNHEALDQTRNGDSIYPANWELLQDNIKVHSKKASKKVANKTQTMIIEPTEKHGIFTPSDKTLKMLKYIKSGNPFFEHITNEKGKMEMEDGLPLIWKIWENSNKQCRPNCSGKGHICNAPMKFTVEGTIPTQWWKERDLAVKNADAKREREGQKISEETKKWIDIYVNKLGIKNVDTNRLSENDAKPLSWGLNEKGRENYAKKTGKVFDKQLLEVTIRRLIELCGKIE